MSFKSLVVRCVALVGLSVLVSLSVHPRAGLRRSRSMLEEETKPSYDVFDLVAGSSSLLGSTFGSLSSRGLASSGLGEVSDSPPSLPSPPTCPVANISNIKCISSPSVMCTGEDGIPCFYSLTCEAALVGYDVDKECVLLKESDAPSDSPSDAPSDMPTFVAGLEGLEAYVLNAVSDGPSDIPSDMPSDWPSTAPVSAVVEEASPDLPRGGVLPEGSSDVCAIPDLAAVTCESGNNIPVICSFDGGPKCTYLTECHATAAGYDTQLQCTSTLTFLINGGLSEPEEAALTRSDAPSDYPSLAPPSDSPSEAPRLAANEPVVASSDFHWSLILSGCPLPVLPSATITCLANSAVLCTTAEGKQCVYDFDCYAFYAGFNVTAQCVSVTATP
jgi:hypothetical protein